MLTFTGDAGGYEQLFPFKTNFFVAILDWVKKIICPFIAGVQIDWGVCVWGGLAS
jgi:hypothetical protein